MKHVVLWNFTSSVFDALEVKIVQTFVEPLVNPAGLSYERSSGDVLLCLLSIPHVILNAI